MRGFAVHLLFVVLAIVCGAAFGVAAVLWWFDRTNANALYLAVGAAIMGVLVLLLQALYLSAERPRRPEPQQSASPRSQPRRQPVRHRTPTRPDLKPVTPRAEPDQVDQETKTSALNALDEHTGH